TRPTKIHRHPVAGARRLPAQQNDILIVGWVSVAHPPFVPHHLICPLKPSQKMIPALFHHHL
ncbi:hypothetical protein ACMSZW_003170, partial [Cronobacter turicensis]